MAAYLEHMAFKVNDLDWCVSFFQDVFGMPVRLSMGEAPNRKIWLHAGIQMNEDLEYRNEDGRCDHFSLMVAENEFDATLQKCLDYGCVQLPMGDNWLKMPNGNVIELNPGNSEALDAILNAKPWID